MTTDPSRPPRIDTGKAHPARVYDWLLGGKDNYPVDEEVGRRLPPEARTGARQNRAFMRRAAAHLAERGIDQFLDVGAGIPTEPNLHQVVQRAVPAARVVYVDNDPIVLRHAEALLVSHPDGATEYVLADAQAPDEIIRQAGRVLDLRRPVALSLIALLHFLPDDERAGAVVRELVGALAPGSHLILTHGASDLNPELAGRATAQYARAGIRLGLRARDEVACFFDGLDLLPPGLVTTTEWPTPVERSAAPENSGVYAGVARKP
ncbi:SAM-dependent methyltransferase [Streptomyces sp. WMMC905]|uniref:SAM-dependent methyltransferase n=1 Tax=Streptomyces sp. WMMC905 TaxID=3404123 RepID=UPI003B92EBBC